jgi:hypothetical protein
VLHARLPEVDAPIAVVTPLEPILEVFIAHDTAEKPGMVIQLHGKRFARQKPIHGLANPLYGGESVGRDIIEVHETP